MCSFLRVQILFTTGDWAFIFKILDGIPYANCTIFLVSDLGAGLIRIAPENGAVSSLTTRSNRYTIRRTNFLAPYDRGSTHLVAANRTSTFDSNDFKGLARREKRTAPFSEA